MRKKQIWRAVYKNNIRNYEQCRPSKNEKAIKLTKLQNFKYERLDFTHLWGLRNSSNFYLNVTEWLASSGVAKCLKNDRRNVKRRTNVFLKRFCMSARKKEGTLSVNKSSSKKSIWQPPMIVPSLAAGQQTVFYYLWPSFYWGK